MDETSNQPSAQPAAVPAAAKDEEKILNDSGVEIVDTVKETLAKAAPAVPPAQALKEVLGVAEKPPAPARMLASTQEKAVSPAPAAAEAGDTAAIEDLEEAFRKETGDRGNPPASAEDRGAQKLEALKKTVALRKNDVKKSVETKLAALKQQKEEIEAGLAKIREFSALEAKIDEEIAKLAQAEAIEKEVREEIADIEQEVGDGR